MKIVKSGQNGWKWTNWDDLVKLIKNGEELVGHKFCSLKAYTPTASTQALPVYFLFQFNLISSFALQSALKVIDIYDDLSRFGRIKNAQTNALILSSQNRLYHTISWSRIIHRMLLSMYPSVRPSVHQEDCQIIPCVYHSFNDWPWLLMINHEFYSCILRWW